MISGRPSESVRKSTAMTVGFSDVALCDVEDGSRAGVLVDSESPEVI
jgi:hypothetical protein